MPRGGTLHPDALGGSGPGGRGDLEAAPARTAPLDGATVFRFYDTYGIPLDLIQDMARDEGVSVDVRGFEEHLESQRTRSRSSSTFEASDAAVWEKLGLPPQHSEFRGYPEHDFVRLSGARVVGLLCEGERVERLRTAREGEAVADRTVFYPEGGGQVGDTGTWTWEGGKAEVLDTQKPVAGVIAHRVRVLSGTLSTGSPSTCGSTSGPPQDPGEPHGDAPAPRRPADGPRRVGAADGLARRSRPAALRLRCGRSDDASEISPRSSVS